MCIDRIVSIFCATGWLMLGPVPGRDDVKNGVVEMPPSTYSATVAGEGAGSGGGSPDDEVLGEDSQPDPAEAAAVPK